ncbi:MULTISPECIES: argininosuccinate lyase [unclassified Apibacter]|uniref:argininosuccinate lyase n=1 Tax=unclassified Apibacter TaxID=2630820 RepID=UPI001321CB8D|nr:MULTISPECIES: argininosuccinate lyase [unclassified Apibacter]MCX8677453.1 argininosuccinate lyase [Apibacter sp. B3919]MXO24341.1 argininosuccinate lyase [Apibacter sp. B3924]MXO27131.1 argininosuccinate lyase [Apibacter sp. B3813]MXO28742.1 argininosuccinate lyase [Apibacter sp. B3913]MXO30695.1 argininosuccinate lyase [Apibacter sp. B3912]
MKLWEKGIPTDQRIDLFTVGNDRELDIVLAKYDVLGSLAQTKMLYQVGLITENEKKDLLQALNEILTDIENHTFKIEENFEDVHSKIEFLLTEKVGDAGKKIHTARSRNDQVLVDMNLYLKDELKVIKDQTRKLFDLLLVLAEKNKNILLPGYTHFQLAMPSSFGMWFSAYAESLIDDVILLNAALKIVDQNPLGSAAGYGSSFPIDRTFTTRELDFKTLKFNSVAAQMSRGKSEKSTAYALSSLAGTLSKLAMDVTLYLSQNFNFLSLPTHLTTGSSIMPHKKNPDVFELIRGKCNKIQALPYELTLITNNLPSGYHRDLQLLKEGIIPGIQNCKACLEMAHYSLQDIQVNKNILDDPKYDYLFTVDALNELVAEGIPFRDAYKIIGQKVEQGTFQSPKKTTHTHEGSINNLCLEEIKKKMDDYWLD